MELLSIENTWAKNSPEIKASCDPFSPCKGTGHFQLSTGKCPRTKPTFEDELAKGVTSNVRKTLRRDFEGQLKIGGYQLPNIT